MSKKDTDSVRADSIQGDSSGRAAGDNQESLKGKEAHPVSPKEPPNKRRKITPGRLELPKVDHLRAQINEARAQQVASLQDSSPRIEGTPGDVSAGKRSALPGSIAPPAPSHKAEVKPKSAEAYNKAARAMLAEFEGDKTESLNPRIVTPAPEGHNKRTLYCQHIHSHMARLNRDVMAVKGPITSRDLVSFKNFVISQPALIRLALDEEESIAKSSSPKIYGNVIRNRIAAYSRMSIESWLEKLRTTIFMDLTDEPNRSAGPRDPATIEVSAELRASDMHAVLDQLKATDLQSLTPHNYVFEPPSNAAIIQAYRGAETVGFWERCDRCNTAFQMLLDRNLETGRFTTNGPCRYHWGRHSYVPGGTDTYRCCGEELGTIGCTYRHDHVWKTTSAPRLASVQPFIKTPANNNRRKDPQGNDVLGVVFDCEMSYTTNGLELVRLTAISWPNKAHLIDVLVRPLGTVIDINTRFSGIKSEWLITSTPYHRDNPPEERQIVGNPEIARGLLCEFLDGDKIPLMGHAIENDLMAVRLCHTNIIDTVLLYPHPRGLPARYGLKALTSDYLKRMIQMGGSEGHDSFEDAAAASDLILLKANEIAKSH